MIVDADCDFHPRDPTDRTWTETTFLPFFIPEPGIFGKLYVLARPNLGLAISSILVSEGLCLQPYEIDFTDSQMHLPCPASFRHYRLANGLQDQLAHQLPALDGFVRLHDIVQRHALGDLVLQAAARQQPVQRRGGARGRRLRGGRP